MRSVASSSGFAGVTCREATGTQPIKTVTEKPEGPIFQNRPESLPPVKILLRGPESFAGPGAPAKTRRDRTPPGPCIVTGPRCHRDWLYRLPREGVRFPAECRSEP